LAVAVINKNRTEKQAQRLGLPRQQNRSGTQPQRFFSISPHFFGVVIGPKCCSVLMYYQKTYYIPKK